MLPEKSAELSFQKKFLEAFFRRKIVSRKQMNSLLALVTWSTGLTIKVNKKSNFLKNNFESIFKKKKRPL